MNEVRLLGRLGRDPELRTAGNGKAYCKFSMAIDRPGRQGEDKQTDWVDVTAWQKAAERVATYGKGDLVFVIGNVRTAPREIDGKKIYETSVWANATYSVNAGPRSGASAPAQRPAADVVEDDDIQF